MLLAYSITRRASFIIFECLVKNAIKKRRWYSLYQRKLWINMNPVPAAAVIQGEQALTGMIGRKASVGGV